MKSTSFRRAIVPGIAVLALALSACGGDNAADAARRRRRRQRRRVGRRLVDRLPDDHRPPASCSSEENPNIQAAVGQAGTGGGFERFCAGETDISDASRPIEDDEIAVCEENGVEYTELQVATDALTVVVHPDLAVDCLTTDQLIELWAPGSKVTNWSQLDPSFPDQEISLFGPGTDSGTYDYMASRRDRRRVRDHS